MRGISKDELILNKASRKIESQEQFKLEISPVLV